MTNQVSSSRSSSGISFTGTLFLIFLVLKLVGVISWSWWWVTAPLWIPAAVVLLFVMFVAPVVSIVVNMWDLTKP